MSTNKKGFIPVLLLVFLLAIIAIVVLLIKIDKLNNPISIGTPIPNHIYTTPSPSPSPMVIYKGDPNNSSWKEFVLTGCSSTNTPPQKYYLQLPASRNITQSTNFVGDVI